MQTDSLLTAMYKMYYIYRYLIFKFHIVLSSIEPKVYAVKKQ